MGVREEGTGGLSERGGTCEGVRLKRREGGRGKGGRGRDVEERGSRAEGKGWRERVRQGGGRVRDEGEMGGAGR